MKIIKPFGTSVTHFEYVDGKPVLKRRLKIKEGPKGGVDIPHFAASHDRLVIRQWVSAIDKILTKPNGSDVPTELHRSFRQHLANACWKLIKEGERLRFDPDDEDLLTKYWRSKIHPYPRGKPRAGARSVRMEGRLYRRFIGKVEITEVAQFRAIDFNQVAQLIQEHLYSAEMSRSFSSKKARGRIELRARGIEASTPPRRLDETETAVSWADAEINIYAGKEDIARIVWNIAEARERERKSISHRDIAGAFHDHFAKVFAARAGGVMTFAEAREWSSPMVDLHDAARNTLMQIVKRSRRNAACADDPGREPTPFTRTLPRSFSDLLSLMSSRSANRELNDLVRLGKIIHYEANVRTAALRDAPDGDDVATGLQMWPDRKAVETSRYWTSEGQAEIKRNEAFVRVWRSWVATSARTLAAWADPEHRVAASLPNNERDILGKKAKEVILGDDFDAVVVRPKTKLLFGKAAETMESQDGHTERAVLGAALESLAHLRHQAFHFKGSGAFSEAIQTLGTANSLSEAHAEHAAPILRELFDGDQEGRSSRLFAEMKASHFENYFDQGRLQTLAGALLVMPSAKVTIPRFKRMLTRAQDALKNEMTDGTLPPTANRKALEVPARLCQYIALKQLYQRPFGAWLSERTPEEITAYVSRTIKRTFQAARNINKDSDIQLLATKAETIVRDEGVTSIWDLTDKITAASAAEMRVQSGYGSNGDAAREQAKYIENFRCDVFAFAFHDYLMKNELRFVLDLDTSKSELAPVISDIERLAAPDMPQTSRTAGNGSDVEAIWRPVLYFLLHLAPVEEVGRLAHQIRKWSVLEERGSEEGQEAPSARNQLLQDVSDIFTLYLDMHDAKTEGGDAVEDMSKLAPLFGGDVELMKRVFPPSGGKEEIDQRVPKRGLREMLRFGDLDAMIEPLSALQITDDKLDAVADYERIEGGSSNVSRSQADRQELHKRWIDKDLDEAGKVDYVLALQKVAHHRFLSNIVSLTTHAKAYRLGLNIVGRLVDFAGLWERDLYFAFLARLHQTGTSLGALRSRARNNLMNGQIYRALGDLRSDERHIKEPVERLFRLSDENGAVRDVRNNLAHLSALRAEAGGLDLTVLVNQTRDLMAYDRKLKNAVSKAVIGILDREGYELRWSMGSDHKLSNARITSKTAQHLRSPKIKEPLHFAGDSLMVASLFNGKALSAKGNIFELKTREEVIATLLASK